MKMKNKNFILYDDVYGQQSLTGLEDTVRVEVSAPEQVKKEPFKPNFKSSWRELEKLEKEFKYDMYCLKADLEKIHSVSKPVQIELGYRSRNFECRLEKLLKNIK